MKDHEPHQQFCIGERLDLLDHCTIWDHKRKPTVLIAFTFGPGPHGLGHESYLYRVEKYARRLGIAAYIPLAAEPIHALYASDTTAVLYGKDIDLAQFVMLPMGLSPDFDRRTAQLVKERVKSASRREGNAQRRAAHPKPLTKNQQFRADHGEEIRALYASGEFTRRQLAERFGVYMNCIEVTLREQP
jgi:hypothetical protein